MTLSLADLKSAICTLILRSLSAINPASEQMALISAPERSSFWLMNSSRSTSSFKDILEVWSVKILRLVFSEHQVSQCKESEVLYLDQLTIGILEENLSVNSARTNKGRIQCLDLIGSHDHLDIATVIKSVQLVE